jgi:hypothetical protein
MPHAIRRALATVTLALVSLAAGADAPPPKPAGCGVAAHRQFDFWLGDWDVTDAKGKPAGRNRIVSLHDGCALQESWTGAGGFTGTSLNAYDADRKRWHQTWVDNSGGVLLLEGEFANGRMVLAGETLDAGRRVLQRITWERLPDARVRQLWESSRDGGTTWTVAFDGYYAKR